ncbi:MAG TPA: amidohydrolase family protein [Candidatus Methylomirabilis sp.]|nr:amidohydrolase family protein [Candidatus Methylomirabilis sp.]
MALQGRAESRGASSAEDLPFELLLMGCRLPDGSVADVGCRHGRIGAIGSPGTHAADRVVTCGGAVLTPGLVEAHIHLDKALLSERTPSREGTLAEAIRVTGEAKRRFSVEDIRSRARAVLDMAVRQGTTAMRGHVEVDPIVGLMGLEALLPLKQEYGPALDLQLCAFAQEGILRAPGTEELLAEALRKGADLVGGCPYSDTDAHAQIDIVFRLAREFGVDADFHTDFFDEAEHLHVRYIAEQTVRHGWQGRVAVGHLTELAALPPEGQDPIIASLREAGIAVIVLPATDLYLMGRRDLKNVRRGLAPVKRLLAGGVTVAAATNNVRNAFTPVGTANLALMGYLLTVGAHMGAAPEIQQALAMLTEHPARILRLPDYGLRIGGRADLVLWETERPEEIITALAPPRLVVKGGRVTVEHERTVREPWRPAEGRGIAARRE